MYENIDNYFWDNPIYHEPQTIKSMQTFQNGANSLEKNLFFEELSLPDIFVYKNCVKLIIKNIFMYFKSSFIKFHKFYINIYISKL